MKRIIYLTRGSKIESLNDEDFFDDFNIELNQDNFYYSYDNLPDKKIHLIFDGFDGGILQNSGNTIKESLNIGEHDEIRFVHHSRTSDFLKEILPNEFENKFVLLDGEGNSRLTFFGRHAQGGQGILYPYLTKIFENNNELTNEIFDEIWEESGFDIDIEEENFLEIKLNFLHKLLAKEEDLELKNKLEEAGYDEINYDKSNHIESLKEVRDYLLDTI